MQPRQCMQQSRQEPYTRIYDLENIYQNVTKFLVFPG